MTLLRALINGLAGAASWLSACLTVAWAVVIACLAGVAVAAALLVGLAGAVVLAAPMGIAWWLSEYPPLGTATALARLRRDVRSALTASSMEETEAILCRALGIRSSDDDSIDGTVTA